MGAVLRVLLGAAIVVGGLFLLVAPGPGSLITLFGLGLLGSEFAPVARALDWAELKVRALARWAKGFWEAAPLALKALIVLLGLAGVTAAGYLAYRLLLAG